MFSSASVQAIAEYLVNTLYISNKVGYSCGQSLDQVYGCAYQALKNLLIKEFGKEVTEKAMNSSTWCVSSFTGQIIPAIQEAIEELKEKKKINRLQKMVNFIKISIPTRARYELDTPGIIVEDGINNWKQIPADWNEIHDFIDNFELF